MVLAEERWNISVEGRCGGSARKEVLRSGQGFDVWAASENTEQDYELKKAL